MKKKNLKKTGISYFAASLLLLAITFVNVRIAMAGDVSFKSMFASSYSGEGGSGEGGSGEGGSGEEGEGGFSEEENGYTPAECRVMGGTYGMTLKCVEHGMSTVKCVIPGKLTLWGDISTEDPSFKVGQYYNVIWDKWSCVEGGGCCFNSSQGVKISQVKDPENEGE